MARTNGLDYASSLAAKLVGLWIAWRPRRALTVIFGRHKVAMMTSQNEAIVRAAAALAGMSSAAALAGHFFL